MKIETTKELSEEIVKLSSDIVDVIKKSKLSLMLVCHVLETIKFDIMINKVITPDGIVEMKHKKGEIRK